MLSIVIEMQNRIVNTAYEDSSNENNKAKSKLQLAHVSSNPFFSK